MCMVTHYLCAYTIRTITSTETPSLATPAPKSRRKPVNVTLDQDLLASARQQNINLSGLLEKSLLDELKRREQIRWMKNNRKAIDAYNKRIATHGVFSDGLRRF